MKPTIVADEMFPEGAGPYMDIEEIEYYRLSLPFRYLHMAAACHFLAERAGGSSALLMDLAANEKSVHGEFFNDFEDLFDDDDLS